MAKIYSPKKLIEVALPLDDINAAAAREKSIRHGHPSTLHLWWARRPLAAARAVIFAQMVNDPSDTVQGDKRLRETQLKITNEREKLFDIIRELVKWENTNNEEVLNKAREAIKESWRFTCELNKKHPQASELFNPKKLPAFHDPFAGGGAIPLEAQRLGLESYASDLNPVAVMINKAMIEIPPKFAGQKPVGPVPEEDRISKKKATKDVFEDWTGAKGIAEDVRRYGYWMKEKAFNNIGHLYPKIKITKEMVVSRPDLKAYENQELTVIAYIWARTVRSPNPRYSNRHVPLISNYVLSSNKKGPSYIAPVIDGDMLSFEVKIGTPPPDAKKGTKAGRGASFTCLLSDTPMSSDYVRSEFQNGRSSTSLLAVVVEGNPGRVYLSATKEIESTAQNCAPDWKPEFLMNQNCKDLVSGRGYGFSKWYQLFTDRQLKALTTFSDLVSEAKNKIVRDLESTGRINDGIPLAKGGTGVLAYAEAVSVYLAFGVDKMTDRHSSFVRWDPTPTASGIINTFSRQAIPMSWDFPEGNPFSSASGNFEGGIEWIVKSLQKLPTCENPGHALQMEAQNQVSSALKVVSTDPPYYDNISYADLSDFFYVWLRSSIRVIYPDLFGTIAVPKDDELVASSHRHGSALDAEKFFLNGMTEAIHNLAVNAHPGFPVSIYYAFKQSETKDTGTASTGWETFLEAVVNSGFSIDGTWPMRTELANRMIASGTNALASSVVLVCKKRGEHAESISRRQFQRELREEMPEALEAMIGGSTGASPIAPVDLAQAAIGPGMAIFSKYEAVLNQDGSKMSVHDALILINRAITDYLNPDSGNFDNDTLFCDDWFSQYGWGQGQFGEADTLARAKGTSVDGVRDAGVIESGGGKVRLLKWSEYPTEWDPETDIRTPVWEACHQMIRALNQQGEAEAGALLARMPEHGEPIRQLAYHLYTLCERKKWAEDARAYNELIGSWHSIVEASHEVGHKGEQQGLDF